MTFAHSPVTMLVVLIAFWLTVAHAAGTKLYVALDGNDAWSGALAAPNAAKTDGPFATLERARDAVRAIERPLRGPVTVFVLGGTHYLAEPLALGPRDSGTEACPITYCAYSGEKPILSGGRRITGPWKKHDAHIYCTHLPDVQAGKWFFRQLRVGGEPQTRARHPNADPSGSYLKGFSFVRSAAGDFQAGLGCLQARGTWLEYDIEIPADGEYTIRAYYANNGNTNKRFFKFTDMSDRTTLSFDGGEPIPLADLVDTGSFYSGFRWSLSGKVRLAKGKHTARWHNAKGGALSLLAFMLCDDPSYAPAIPKSGHIAAPGSGRHAVIFQAERYDRKHGDLVRTMTFMDRRDKWFHTHFAFEPGALEAWPQSPDAEIFVIPEYDWVSELVRLVHVDEAQQLATVEGANATKPFMPNNRFYAVNVLEALDEPGEWCLVRNTGTLYYWPKSDGFTQQEIVAPALDRVIELRGDAQHPVQHVNIEGFTIVDTRFTAPERLKDTYHADDAAVWLWAAQRCRIARNTFRDVGGYGVMLRDASTHNEIVENEIAGAGQGGIYLNGFADVPRKPAADGRRPAHNLVAGNYIHHCGRHYVHVAGVYLACSENNTIAHNDIHDMTRYAISLKQYCPGNVIEYNDVRRTNLATRDTGSIEMCNKGACEVRYNLVVDSMGCGYNNKAGRHLCPQDACAIYLDNMSSNQHVHGNICVRGASGMWVNWGSNNLIENNIFVDSRDRQTIFNYNKRKGWETSGNRFMHNIVYSARAGSTVYGLGGWRDRRDVVDCDYNLVFAGGKEPAHEYAAKPLPWSEWQALGQDAHSVVAAPLFVDAARDDYRLRPGSPAFKLGFKPIAVERIGRRGYVRK